MGRRRRVGGGLINFHSLRIYNFEGIIKKLELTE